MPMQEPGPRSSDRARPSPALVGRNYLQLTTPIISMREIKTTNIPNVLTALNQWVGWRYEQRNGKPSKVPYNAVTGRLASSTEPSDWTALDVAVQSLHRNQCDGVGFVFTKDSGITGIDLDMCRDPETGEIAPWAKDVIKGVHSYTEVTPSGRGLHVLVLGTLPAGQRRKEVTNPEAMRFTTPEEGRKPGIEMYDTGRYFTVTGQHLEGTPDQLEVCQEQLAAFHGAVFHVKPATPSTQAVTTATPLDDSSLVDRARTAKNGEKFARLYDRGDTSEYPSHSEADLALCSFLSFWSGRDPEQIDRLFRNSRLMRDKWERSAGQSTYGQVTIERAIASTAEVYEPSRSIECRRGRLGSVPELLSFHHNDAGNASRLIAIFGNNLRYCHAMKKWLVWDGRRWMVDKTDQAKKLVKVMMLEFLRQAVAHGDKDAEKFAKRSMDEKRVTSALASAECEIFVTPDELDCNPFLLNCHNGTLDLRSGGLGEHRREDYITKLCHVNYDPRAECSQFMNFLTRIMGGGPLANAEDQERAGRLVSYLQKALGYALTGDVSEKAVFCLFGKGNNGKSTLLSAFRHVVQEYSVLLQIDTLMTRQQESNNSLADLADLRGARFAMTSETEEGQRLAVGKLKRITQGMGQIKAVRKYENPIEFPETHKLFMDANHRPLIPETEEAIWNRLRPIPFTITIPDDEIDHQLLDKLKLEAEGILAWAVAGCLAWQQEGLGSVPEVEAASSEWRSESNRFSEFLDDRCILEPENEACWVPVATLWPSYQQWVESNREKAPLSKQKFDDKLLRLGCKRARKNHERIWAGIRFRTEVDDRKPAEVERKAA
jgi:putative DNA primase/helicase